MDPLGLGEVMRENWKKKTRFLPSLTVPKGPPPLAFLRVGVGMGGEPKSINHGAPNDGILTKQPIVEKTFF